MARSSTGHNLMRILLLSLLDERSGTAEELACRIAGRLGGGYTWAPGVTSLRLGQMRRDGLIVQDRVSGGYRLAEAGRVELRAHRGELAALTDGAGLSLAGLADAICSDVAETTIDLRVRAQRTAAGRPPRPRRAGRGPHRARYATWSCGPGPGGRGPRTTPPGDPDGRRSGPESPGAPWAGQAGATPDGPEGDRPGGAALADALDRFADRLNTLADAVCDVAAKRPGQIAACVAILDDAITRMRDVTSRRDSD